MENGEVSLEDLQVQVHHLKRTFGDEAAKDLPLMLIYAMNSGLPVHPQVMDNMHLFMPSFQPMNILSQGTLRTTLVERFAELDYMLSE